MKKEKLFPYEYFTLDRVLARKRGDIPPVLFHWTRSLEKAGSILDDGAIKGSPTVRTTENPAFGTPGPVVFV